MKQRKCKTKDCDRKVTPPEVYCSLECYAYDGNKLARNAYSYKFFQNVDCKYFPCHKVKDIKNFSCLWCYCPLYSFCEDAKEDKCKDCLIPHLKENYDDIIENLRVRYGNKI